jgi:hypothetical protein
MGIKRTKKQGILKDDLLKEINDGHYIELTDRCHVMASMFYDHVCEHPLAIENKEIKQLTDKISELHYELYQLVANKMFDKNE